MTSGVAEEGNIYYRKTTQKKIKSWDLLERIFETRNDLAYWMQKKRKRTQLTSSQE